MRLYQATDVVEFLKHCCVSCQDVIRFWNSCSLAVLCHLCVLCFSPSLAEVNATRVAITIPTVVQIIMPPVGCQPHLWEAARCLVALTSVRATTANATRHDVTFHRVVSTRCDHPTWAVSWIGWLMLDMVCHMVPYGSIWCHIYRFTRDSDIIYNSLWCSPFTYRYNWILLVPVKTALFTYV